MIEKSVNLVLLGLYRIFLPTFHPFLSPLLFLFCLVFIPLLSLFCLLFISLLSPFYPFLSLFYLPFIPFYPPFIPLLSPFYTFLFPFILLYNLPPPLNLLSLFPIYSFSTFPSSLLSFPSSLPSLPLSSLPYLLSPSSLSSPDT